MAEPNELQSYQELYEQLRQPAQMTEEYREFLAYMQALNYKMEMLYTKDAYGRIPLVTAEDKEQLLELHRQLGIASEKLLDDPGNLEKTAVEKIAKLSSLNQTFTGAMRDYDPKKGKALHTIHEEARTPVLDLRNQQLKAKLGGSINKRQPLTFLDPKGREITGVFIPEKREDHLGNLKDGIKKAAGMAVSQKGKNFLNNLVKILSEGLGENAGELDKLLQLKGLTVSDPPVFTSKEISKILKQIVFRRRPQYAVSLTNDVGTRAMSLLTDVLNANLHALEMNVHAAQIVPGTRLDTRNAGMSAAAELFGCPDVVARARPMQIIDEQGRTVNGTFMTEAQGFDPGNPPPEAANIKPTAAEGTDGKAFRQIADLQVLDYICGNIDRHSNNFFVSFDKNGKLAGVQGIDNDCSWGLRIPKRGEGFNLTMVGTDDMRVISKSMYDHIKDMTKEEMKFSMRGYGASEAELDAAWERLKKVRDKAKADIEYFANKPDKKPERGRVLIVPDSEFKNLKMKDLTVYRQVKFRGETVSVANNLFARTMDNIREFPELYREKQEELKAARKQRETLRSEIAIGQDNRANPGAIRKNADQAKKLEEEMGKRTNPWKLFWKTSPAYENMETAMKNYREYQRKLVERLELAQDPNYLDKPGNAGKNVDWDAIVSKEDMDKMRELGKRVFETANVYCEGKKDVNLETASPYVKNRIEIGQMSRRFGQKAMEALSPQELLTIGQNEKLAKENEERTLGNRAEAEAHRNGPKL